MLQKVQTLFKRPLRSTKKLFRFLIRDVLPTIIDPVLCFLHQPFRRNREIQKFVIISTHRTGSTMLCDKLNSHPKITCHGELFPKRSPDIITPTSRIFRYIFYLFRNLTPLFFIQLIWQKCPKQTKVVGFKIFHNHNQRAYDHLLKNQKVKKIILTRTNPVRHYLSKKMLEQTDVAHKSSNEKTRYKQMKALSVYKPTKLNLDANQMVQWVEKTANDFEQARNTLRNTNQDWLELSYEDIKSGDSKIKELLQYLNVDEYQALKTELKKMHSGHLQEYIGNYTEVKTKLKGTELEFYLKSE